MITWDKKETSQCNAIQPQSIDTNNTYHHAHTQYKAQFIGVTVVSALALNYAYVAVASAHEAKLLAGRCVVCDIGGGRARFARLCFALLC
jgi:hypothetical protein